MSAGGTDKAKPQQARRRWRRAQRLLDRALLLAAFVFVYASLRGSSPLLIMVAFFGIGVSMLAASIILHELGHALAACLVRWRLIVIAVWPVALHLPSWALVINRRISTADGGGYVVAAPGSIQSATRFNRIVVSLGGPLASLAATFWCFAIATAPRPDPGIVYDMGVIGWALTNHDLPVTRAANLVGGFAIFNLRSFVWTIVPMTYWTGVNSDGRNILNALKGKGDTDGSWSRWISMMLYYNVRLRDIPAWMYDAASSGSGKFEEDPSSHDGLAISRALDASTVHVERVRAQIEAYRVAYGDNDWLLNCDAWLAAAYENNIAQAEKALSLRKGDGSYCKPLQSAVEAAVAARRGQHENVTAKLLLMKQELLAASVFPNATFRDMRQTIESIAAKTPPATA